MSEDDTGRCSITGREKKEGTDGIERVPCDRCGSADESALEGPAGSELLLCSDCYDQVDAEERLWYAPAAIAVCVLAPTIVFAIDGLYLPAAMHFLATTCVVCLYEGRLVPWWFW